MLLLLLLLLSCCSPGLYDDNDTTWRGHRTILDNELGKGQGVSDLIERSSREPSGTLHSVCPEDRAGRRALSPASARTEQLRQTTFSMTLDFIERLTMSSAKLARHHRVCPQHNLALLGEACALSSRYTLFPEETCL
jgi:hypothetical protein